MKASLAMVVCFIGFQGIVPEAGSSADASTLDAARVYSTPSSTEDSLPTGTVGPSLLATLEAQDALDPLAPRKARGGAIHSQDITKSPGAAPAKRPAAGSLFAPLEELVPTSSFGFRTSPITGEVGEFHTGQDYAAPCGTTVFAADAGTVRAVGWHPWGGGNRVEVDHGNGLITTYNHLQGISVRAGDLVNGGDPIAALGTTGSSTGCHLHFETILDGEHVDPLGWKLVHTAPGTRQGELKDFTPGGASSTEVPEWAQSSTRSDQPVPVTVPFSALDGVAGAGGSGTGVLTGPSASPSDVGAFVTRPAPPVVTLPRPEKSPATVVTAPGAGLIPDTSPDKPTTPNKPATPGKPGSGKPSPKVPSPGHTAPAPQVQVPGGKAPTTVGTPSTPTPHVQVPGGKAPTTVGTPSTPAPHVQVPDDKTTKPVQTPVDEGKPSKPVQTPVDEGRPSAPAEPAPTDAAEPAPEAPVAPAPSCDVVPSDAPDGEKSGTAADAVVPQLPETAAVTTASADVTSTDKSVAAEDGTALDGTATNEDTDEASIPCGDPEAAKTPDDAPTDGEPAAPTQDQAGTSEVPAREQG